MFFYLFRQVTCHFALFCISIWYIPEPSSRQNTYISIGSALSWTNMFEFCINALYPAPTWISERPKSAGHCRDSVVVSWEKIHFYQSMALGYVTLVLMCSHALKKVIKIFNLLHCTKKTTKIRIVSCCLIVLGDQLRRIVKICFCY